VQQDLCENVWRAMKKIIKKLKAGGPQEVLILGDLMVDEYTFGSVERVSPEAPVPIVKESRKEWYLGGAANVAANCKHIGFNVNVIGVINAHDVVGQKLRALLQEISIPLDGIVCSSSRPTTCKKR